MERPMNRRQLLAGLSAAAGGVLWPRGAAASVAPADRRLILIFASGGWDVTRVFAPEFDTTGAAMEDDASPWTIGDLRLVDHRERPSVRAFFERWHARCVALNGILVEGTAHEVCLRRAMTGTLAEAAPDWPAIVAAEGQAAYTLPQLVLGGPSLAGPLGRYVARAGQAGQLGGLLSGEILDESELSFPRLSSASVGVMDRYLERRVAARAAGARSAQAAQLTGALEESLGRALELKDYRYVTDFVGGTGLEQQIELGVEALSLGLSRCVTMAHPSDAQGAAWDSHSDNDATQSLLFEELFAALIQLMEHLDATPGARAPTLAEETTIAVLSEMGRSPEENAGEGKDHWPFTSALLIGAGLDGGRTVGGYDERFQGERVDLATGEVDPGGASVTSATFGATLLALAGVDPAEHLGPVEPLEGILG